MTNLDKRYSLTIVVPAYNVEAYIKQTLLSIISQMTDEVELLIINDGSKDGTLEVIDAIINKHKQTNIKPISIQNGGVSAARNLGVVESNGRYLMFVDADDLMVDGSIGEILKMTSDGRPDVVCGGAFWFDTKPAANRAMGRMLKDAEIKILEGLEGHGAYTMLLSSGVFNPGAWANIFKRDMIVKKGILFDTEMTNNEDIDYVMRAFLESSRFTSLHAPHYLYRKYRTGSASNVHSSKRINSSLDFIKKWQTILRTIPEESPVKSFLKDYIAYQYAILIGSLYTMDSRTRGVLEEQVRSQEGALKSHKSTKTKTVYILYRIFGFKTTAHVLAAFIKLKEKNRA